MRANSSHAIAGLLALVVLVSGCTSGGTEDPDPDTVKPTDGVTPPPDATKGRVEGFVIDQFGTPVPGAHVVLQGTAYVDVADNVGRYEIANVDPGTYTLSASQEKYALEAPKTVEVAAGLVTRANLTLLAEVEDSGGRPHTHDWWGQTTSLTIMDRDLDLDGWPACAGGVALKGCTLPLGTEFVVRFQSPEDPAERPNIVFQGTGKLRLEVTVPNAVGAMDVLVKLPSQDGLTKILTFDGGTDSAEIDVSADDWDAAHVRTSQWFFEMRCQSAAVVSEPCGAVGPIHWNVVVERGPEPIPLEKAHPDYWQDQTYLKPLEDTCNYTILPTGQYLYMTAQPQCAGGIEIPEGASVLPGTGVMRVTLAYQNEAPTPISLGLRYRTPAGTGWADLETPISETAAPPTGGLETRVFELELRPEQWDSPYAGTEESPSQWGFFVFMTDPVPPTEQTGSYNGFFSGDVTFTVETWKQGHSPA